MKPWVFTFRCVLLLLVLLVNVEAAKKGGIKKKGGVTKQSSSSSSSEVMVDIGVGPSMIFYPALGVTIGPFITGLIWTYMR
jgi:hypothetical protein